MENKYIIFLILFISLTCFIILNAYLQFLSNWFSLVAGIGLTVNIVYGLWLATD